MSGGRRICIVGAGPAGLVAAHHLRRKGYHEVCVFEARDRVGGKCCTVEHGGRTYDLGAVLAAQGYENVLRLAEHYGVEVVEGPRHELIGPVSGARLAWPAAVDLGSPATRRALARLLYQLAKNRSLARPGFSDLGPDLHLPAREYVDRHGLRPVADLLLPLLTGYGYGYAEEIPAAYLFKLALLGAPRNAAGFWRWLRLKAGLSPRGLLGRYFDSVMFKGGYQLLFERIASDVHVELGARVERIERGEDGVRLALAGGERRSFDRLILAIDPREIAKVVDLDPRERALLEQVRFVDYQSILCEVENAPPRRALFFPRHMSADRRGHLLVLSQPGVPDHVCVAYAIGGDGDVVSLVAADLERVGARLRKVIAHKRWSYFPHLASHQMRAFYRAMEGLQGARNTCYAGEVMSFSTVENVSEYSRALVDRFF